MDSGLELIYAGMREKTHSASTQLKGTGTFEGTVTDLINLLEVWETSQNRVVERSTIAQSRRRRFHSNGLQGRGLIFANCTWPADLLANHFGNVDRQ